MRLRMKLEFVRLAGGTFFLLYSVFENIVDNIKQHSQQINNQTPGFIICNPELFLLC